MKRTTKLLCTILAIVLLLTLGVSAAVQVGDVNGDGKVTVFDAQMLLEAQLGLRQLTEDQLTNKGDASVQDVIDQVLRAEPAQTEPGETDPELDADTIALVTNGDETVQVKSVADMIAAVSNTGNTTIKLYQDVTTTSAIVLPYCCTLDLNGHTVQTNLTSGNGIQITALGTQNNTTTIKNGTLVNYDVGIRIGKGAVVIDNMTVRTLAGPCIAVYENKAEYKNINRISNSTIVAENYVCFSFHLGNTDYSINGVSLDNSVLINARTKTGVGTIIGCRDTTCVMAPVHIGENVKFYSTAPTPNNTVAIPYTGKPLNYVPGKATVTVGQITYSNLNHWSTEAELPARKILLVGNSFSNRLGEELHEMAEQNGEELYIANLYYGGCNVEQHWTWLQNDTPNYEYYVHSALGRWKDPTITTLSDALAAEDWEVITLQQHFSPERTGTYEVALNSCVPYVKNLFDHMAKSNPDAKLYWYQTWAYSAAHEKIGTVEVQTNQYNQIKAVSDYLAEECGVPQLPVGDAWQIARANPLITADPCLSDNYHQGTTTGGRYLNACVFYETIFGKTCVGNTAAPYSYTLDATLMAQLQLAAHQAVADLYGADYVK